MGPAVAFHLDVAGLLIHGDGLDLVEGDFLAVDRLNEALAVVVVLARGAARGFGSRLGIAVGLLAVADAIVVDGVLVQMGVHVTQLNTVLRFILHHDRARRDGVEEEVAFDIGHIIPGVQLVAQVEARDRVAVQKALARGVVESRVIVGDELAVIERHRVIAIASARGGGGGRSIQGQLGNAEGQRCGQRLVALRGLFGPRRRCLVSVGRFGGGEGEAQRAGGQAQGKAQGRRAVLQGGKGSRVVFHGSPVTGQRSGFGTARRSCGAVTAQIAHA